MLWYILDTGDWHAALLLFRYLIDYPVDLIGTKRNNAVVNQCPSDNNREHHFYLFPLIDIYFA